MNETYGALAAHWQAENASDPRVRAVMAQIAGEETTHAELSWDLAAWLDERLTDDERAAVDRARADAYRELEEGLRIEHDDEVVEIVGVPPARVALELLARLDAAIAIA